jgi:glycosyltransferase involved in cell wall biosynthesis
VKRPTIYFWQPVLTDHAIFTFKAAADSLGMPAKCISDRAELDARREQGWHAATQILPIEILSESEWREKIEAIICGDPANIHIFASPFEKSRINYALHLACRKQRQVFLSSEPYSPIPLGYLDDRFPLREWLKSKLRPLLYRIRRLKYANRICGVFAISPLAVKQFKLFGVKSERIFPFGYFVPNIKLPKQAINQRTGQGLKTAFVGSLIKRKGVLTAIEAFRCFDASVATLDIFGPGSHAAYSQVPDNVIFRGRISFGETQKVLQEYDLLIVPSLHDGWAVVVNEAIMAGIPVVASCETGASAMIDRWHCGATFQAGDANALAKILSDLAANPALLVQAKAQAQLLAPLLEPEVAGNFMAGCILASIHGKAAPSCPWY